MEYREFTGKTVEDAVMEAAIKLETTSDRMEYEVLEKGSNGFLGIGSKPARIRARKVMETAERAEKFLLLKFCHFGQKSTAGLHFSEGYPPYPQAFVCIHQD